MDDRGAGSGRDRHPDLTADAAAVSAGAQVVTATVSAATFDPNPANNTASAAETSQYPPITAAISPATGGGPINVCATPPDPVTSTFNGSVANAANPDAAPSSVGNVTYTWSCDSFGTSTGGCPTPVNDITNSTFVTYNNADFVLGATYRVYLVVTPDNQSQYRMTASADSTFTTTCIV